MNWPTDITVGVIGMVSTILAVLAGGLISLVTTHINRKDQAQQRAEERERWYHEFRLPRQLDILSTLYADAVSLHSAIDDAAWLDFFGDDKELTESLLAINTLSDAYERSAALAFIYLSPEGRRIVTHYTYAATSRTNHLWPRSDTTPADRDSKLAESEKLEKEAYEDLTNYLQNELAAPTIPSAPSRSAKS